MKKSIVWLISRIVLVMAFCLYSLILFSQERNLKTEILVFIMPDSLELPAQAKNRVALTSVTINSKNLSDALQKVKSTGIAKAFPDWQKEKSQVTVEAKVVEAPPFDRIFTLTFNTEAEADDAINILSKTNGVVFAEKHSEPTMDNDIHYINGDQWYLNNNGANGGVVGADINAEGAWATYTGNTNNTIAIIDNGVEITHEDLTGKASGDTPVGHSHGTSVAGIAAARANNTHGIRGVDWNAQILSKRVRDSNDDWLGDNVAAQKIADAVNEGADVLNCSWSGPVNSSTLAVAFAYAYRANRVTVATMGNTGIQETRYPGALLNVMAVGATQNDDTRSPFSTTGTHIDVVAPGGTNPAGFTNAEDIITTTTNNNYEYVSGTSFAAPQVAGLASLLEGYNSNLDNDDIRQIIRLSADDRGILGFDNQYGYGRINAGRALEFLQEPYALRQWTGTSGSSVGSTGTFQMVIMGASGLASAVYIVKRYEVQKSVIFPENFLHIEGVWTRGAFTTGWNLANPNFGEGFCEIVPGTLTATGATLRTYVYQVWNVLGSYLGYYPTTPANVNFAYTVLGIPQPTISAPDVICYSGHTISLQDPPENTTITWGGTNVAYPNGNTGTTVTVRAAGSTTSNTGTITASFTIDGTPYTVSETVWVGAPKIDYISGPTYTPNYQWATYQALPNDLQMVVDDYNWILSPLNGNSVYDYGWTCDIAFYNSGYYQVVTQAHNTCGWGSYSVLGVEVYDSKSLSVSPNPSSGEVTIAIESTDEKELLAEEWDLEIYNNNQTLKEKKTKLKGNEYHLNTSGWKDGVYMLRVNYKNEILTGKLVVKR